MEYPDDLEMEYELEQLVEENSKIIGYCFEKQESIK